MTVTGAAEVFIGFREYSAPVCSLSERDRNVSSFTWWLLFCSFCRCDASWCHCRTSPAKVFLFFLLLATKIQYIWSWGLKLPARDFHCPTWLERWKKEFVFFAYGSEELYLLRFCYYCVISVFVQWPRSSSIWRHICEEVKLETSSHVSLFVVLSSCSHDLKRPWLLLLFVSSICVQPCLHLSTSLYTSTTTRSLKLFFSTLHYEKEKCCPGQEKKIDSK